MALMERDESRGVRWMYGLTLSWALRTDAGVSGMVVERSAMVMVRLHGEIFGGSDFRPRAEVPRCLTSYMAVVFAITATHLCPTLSCHPAPASRCP